MNVYPTDSKLTPEELEKCLKVMDKCVKLYCEVDNMIKYHRDFSALASLFYKQMSQGYDIAFMLYQSLETKRIDMKKLKKFQKREERLKGKLIG